MSALGALADLSNIDKHRVVHAVARPAAQAVFRFTLGPDDFHNCTPDLGRAIEARPLGGRPLKRGDVLRVYVNPTGPNPGVDLDANLTAHITFHGDWDLPQSLNAMWGEVNHILTLYAPYLE